MINQKVKLLVVAIMLLVPCIAFALPGKHDPLSGGLGFTCNSCHLEGNTLGLSDTGTEFTNNLCLTCHKPGDANTKKGFIANDFANPFNSSPLSRVKPVQSSHKWSGPEVVPAAGAAKAVDLASNGLNNSYYSGSLACSKCHSVHGNGSAGSNASTAPYLRTVNDSDQMCRNCHRSRDTTDHKTGSHPVNVSYTSARVMSKVVSGDLLETRLIPSNAANPTGMVKIINNKVVCSTCHGVHNADSRTSTFDGFTTASGFNQLSSSKGYLLRVDEYGKTADDVNICTNCHSGRKNHNLGAKNGSKPVQCNDCHGAHVAYDAAAIASGTAAEKLPNNNLIRRYLQYTTAGRVNKRIFYRYTGSAKEYYSSNGKGVCQSCHTPPLDHFTGGSYGGAFPDSGHLACASCHNHKNTTPGSGAFSFGVGGTCTSDCHGLPPVNMNTTGNGRKAEGYAGFDETTTPHASHASAAPYYEFTCNQCHKGYSMPQSPLAASNFVELFKNHTGLYAGPIAKYTPSAGYPALATCNNVYCHSNGNGAYKAGQQAIQWGAGKLGTIGGLAAASRCVTCHDGPTIATGSHTQHVVNRGYGCVTCHAATVSDNTTVLPAAMTDSGNHVNTIKDVDFNGVAPATSVSGTCSDIACHSNGKGSNPFTTPVWGNAATGACGACHSTNSTPTVLASGSHTTHFAVILAKTPAATQAQICASCHTYTTATAATHVDGQLTSQIKNDATGCGVCHADPYTSATGTAPTWGTSASGCSACHKNGGAFTGVGSGPATGTHNKHMSLTGTSCSTCHAGAVANSNGGTAHTDGDVDVALSAGSYSLLNVTKHAAGSYTGTCTTTLCHVSAGGTNAIQTVAWGTVPADGAAACAVCHNASGYLGAAFDPATGAPTSQNDAHKKHMNLAGSGCDQCHAGATKNVSGGVYGTTHIDGNIDATGTAATYSVANGAKHSTASTGTCASVSCHVGPYNATPITTAVWGTTGSAGCASCHTGTGALTGTGSGPATGTHNLHMALTGTTCSTCHTGAAGNISGGATHVNGTIEAIGYPVTAKHTVNTGYTGTCTTAACHRNQYADLPVDSTTWGTSTTAASAARCAVCHKGTPGQFTADGSPNTGSHGKHMALGGAACNQCHAGATKDSTGGTYGTTHVDGNIDVVVATGSYALSNITKHTAGTYTGGTCATSCHLSAYNASQVTATTVWGSTGLAACTACHTGTPGSFDVTTGAPATGSHVVHMALAGSACNQCHASSVAFTSGGASHNNGTVEVTGGYAASPVAKHVAGTYNASTAKCSTSSCHGSNVLTPSPVWGTNLSTSDACTKCHGTLTAAGTITAAAKNLYLEAPSLPAGLNDPAKGNVSANVKTGAHQTHLRFSNGFSNYSTMEFRCESCHGSLAAKTIIHADGTSAPVFGKLATNNTLTPMVATWAPASLTCANTYCHNPAAAVGGTLNSANVGTRTFVSWTASSYLGDTAKSDNNCNRCHKSPNVAGTATLAGGFSHAGVLLGNTCVGCHGHDGDTQGPVGHRHMDGKKWGTGGSGCTGCHGYPPMSPAELALGTGAGNFSQASTLGYNAAPGGGHHRTHLSQTITETDGFTPCMPCHDLATHQSGGLAEVNLAGDLNYRFDSTRPKGFNKTAKTCSNISCHFQPTTAW